MMMTNVNVLVNDLNDSRNSSVHNKTSNLHRLTNIWQKDFAVIRKLIESENEMEKCPSCEMPFDKAKKRKLIDTCGHERCYSCMFEQDSCPQCHLLKHDDRSLTEKKCIKIEPEDRNSENFHGSEITLCEEKVTNTKEKHEMEVSKSKSKDNDKITRSINKLPPTSFHKTNVMSQSFPFNKVPTSKKKTFMKSPFSLTSSNRSSRSSLRSQIIQQDDLSSQSGAKVMSMSSSMDSKNWSSVLFGKLKSLWSINSSSVGLNQLTDQDNSILKTKTKKGSQADFYSRLNLLLDENHKTSKSTSPMSTLTTASSEERACCNHSENCSGSIGSFASISLSDNSNISCSPLASRRYSLIAGQVNNNATEDQLSLRKFRRSRHHRKSSRSPSPYDGGIISAISKAKLQQLSLKPIFFEVPLHEKDTIFLGRHWLFKKIFEVLETSNGIGVVISGNPGSGKTALILQIVETSCFGEQKDDSDVTFSNYRNTMHSSSKSESISGRINKDATNLNGHFDNYYQYDSQNIYSQPVDDDKLVELASRVIGYHFCQADNNETCIVADFIHSLAAQLCQAPQLVAYREYVLGDANVQTLLSINECIANPSRSFSKGILEPLVLLKKSEKLTENQYLVLVDALCEAEYHRPDYGDTIMSFLIRHKSDMPPFLKFILTIRSHFEELSTPLNCVTIDLNKININDNIQKDLQIYVNYRMAQSSSLLKNTTALNSETVNGGNCGTGSGSRNGNNQNDSNHNYSHFKFSQYLISKSEGSFLFVKLVLDLIEHGELVLNPSNFKNLPISLSQIFLLHFNLRFPDSESYEKVEKVLSICLASLYPLTLVEIYYSFSALFVHETVCWTEFINYIKQLRGFLVKRCDNTFMFFHPSFREWLIRRDDNESTKYLCDLRVGHAGVAFRFSRLQMQTPLDECKTLELGHHVLKAHIFRNQNFSSVSTRDLQAFWMTTCSDNVSLAVSSIRNIYNPNIKVSRLLMLAGSSPDYVTDFLGRAPILCIYSHEGILPMVSMMLEFGANVHLTNEQGCTALILAASKGHIEVVQLLLSKGSCLSRVDKQGRCALVYAAYHGHFNTVSLLLDCTWKTDDQFQTVRMQQAIQQSLVAACSQGHNDIVEYLLDNFNEIDTGFVDELIDETAFTAAALNGHQSVCCTLMNRSVNPSIVNKKGMTPLMNAAKAGHWSIVELLTQAKLDLKQADSNGKTALMMAAIEEHLEIIDLLLEKGAEIDDQDSDGLTALSWACLKGRLKSVELLLDNRANVNHCDKNGRISLDLAAFQGNPLIVQALFERGAHIEHIDLNGMRPLDRAIGCHNVQVVKFFLRKGAKLGPATWAMASGKLDISLILLNKLLDDGNLLYRKGRFQDASVRFSYALKKIPAESEISSGYFSEFNRLKISFLLNDSRCKRKLKNFDEAIQLANQVFDLKPKSFEAFYARAKAHIDNESYNLALSDIECALNVISNNRTHTKNFLLILRSNIVEKLQNKFNS